METKKIAAACFIGGVLCSSVAWLFTPTYWWLGLIAGIAGGYISYDFREVRTAVPVACRLARKKGAGLLENLYAQARAWLAKPHPFVYPAALVTVPFYLLALFYNAPFIGQTIVDAGIFGRLIMSVIVTIGVPLVFVEVTCIMTVPIVMLAYIGIRVGEESYWWPFLCIPTEAEMLDTAKHLDKQGLRRQLITYSNVDRWMAKGLGLTILFFVFTLWKYLLVGAWQMICLFGRFLWHFFKLIHSNKRVLCAIDGTLGGMVSYFWFVSSAESLSSHIVLVLFGGLLGAALGVARMARRNIG